MSRLDLPSSALTRRSLLGGVGVAVVGSFIGGRAVGIAMSSPASPLLTIGDRFTYADWLSTRGNNYYIAHRGSGDVFPEHSMEAYQAATAWGAVALEISVGMTSDGVLICMHDTTYDRTTNAKGSLGGQPSTILRGTHIVAPQLGPAWAREPRPQVPLLEDVLRRFGGRVILCLEAKVDAAYPGIIAMVDQYGLRDCVMIKAFHTSSRIAEAKAAGLPVFGYLGSEISTPSIDALAAQLNPVSDVLVIPNFPGEEALAHAVATKVPVWVYAVHKRSDADYHFARGVQGVVTSSYGYVSTRRAVATRDTWAAGAVASGEMSRDPSTARWAPEWRPDGSLRLGLEGHQHFMTLGQLSPVQNAQQSYSVTFSAAFSKAPTDPSSNVSLAFGHVDDEYYEHQVGLSNGYHAILRFDGRLELYEHRVGKKSGTQLGTTLRTPPPVVGRWMDFRLDVTPTSLAWARIDAGPTSVRAQRTAHRGGYLHVGRSAPDGALDLRRLAVTTPSG